MKKLKLKNNCYAGKLIVFEGVDGSGKTSLMQIASDYLTSKNIEYIKIKMPSDFVRSNPIFDAYDNSKNDSIRKTVNLTNLTIFVSGDRLLTLDSIIIPALKEGKCVLCDRYCYTGYVRCTEKIIEKISNKFIKPDVVFLPFASPLTLKNRVKTRINEKNNYYNEEDVKIQIQKFDFLAKKCNFIKINTENNLDITIQKLCAIVDKILFFKIH